MENSSDLDILRRIAERGLNLSSEKQDVYVDDLDSIVRIDFRACLFPRNAVAYRQFRLQDGRVRKFVRYQLSKPSPIQAGS